VRSVVVALAMLIAAPAHAEDGDGRPDAVDRPRFGPRLGVNLATIDDSAARNEFSKRIAPTVGGFLLMPIPAHLWLSKLSIFVECGLAYSQKGSASPSGLDELRLDYIQVPATFVAAYQVGPVARFRGFVGPNANVKIAEKDLGGGELDLDGSATAIDYGILGGAGLEIDTDKGVIILDVRYEYGLTDVDTGMDHVSHRVVSATAGFAY
jgi:hypothetical protein